MRNDLSDDDLARVWLKTITACTYVPDSAEEIVPFLRGCVTEVRVARATSSPALDSAVRCGERIVQHLYLSVEALVVSLDLLDREVGPAGGSAQEQAWWSQWRNKFTQGAMSALLKRIRQEQQELHDAFQDALKTQGREMLRQCRAECAATASAAMCCGVALLAAEQGQPETATDSPQSRKPRWRR